MSVTRTSVHVMPTLANPDPTDAVAAHLDANGLVRVAADMQPVDQSLAAAREHLLSATLTKYPGVVLASVLQAVRSALVVVAYRAGYGVALDTSEDDDVIDDALAAAAVLVGPGVTSVLVRSQSSGKHGVGRRRGSDRVRRLVSDRHSNRRCRGGRRTRLTGIDAGQG